MALALTSRRRAVAAAASAVTAVALAVSVAGKRCGVADPGPEAAVRALLAAASAGDRHAVFDLLAPETQHQLAEGARRSTDLGGSSLRYGPLDLISIGGASEAPPPSDITVVQQVGDRAIVEVVSPAGRDQLAVRRVDGRWRVELPSYGRP